VRQAIPAVLLAAVVAAGCAPGRVAARIAFFEPAGTVGHGEYHYYPLKVAARGRWIAVLDGSPNLGYRNSRVLLFQKSSARLVATSEIPRGTRRGAKGSALWIDPRGRIYVAVEDVETTHLLRLTPMAGGQGFTQEWDSIRGGSYPTGIFADAAGTVVLVDGGNHRIIRLPWKGMDPQVLGSSRELDHPRGLAVDASWNVYTHTIRAGKLWLLKYAPDGRLAAEVPVDGLKEPLAWFYNDVVVDSLGRLYLSDYAKARVLILDPSGKVISEIAHPGFKGPMGLALDETDHLYVADAWAKSVFRFRPVYEHEIKGKVAGTPPRR